MDCLVECPVCEEAYNDEARLLPCLHSLCWRCVQDIARIAEEDSKSIVCPICGEPFDARLLSVNCAAKTTNVHLNKNKPGFACTVHPSYDLAAFCRVCKQTVCDACVQQGHQHVRHEGDPIVSLNDAEQLCQADLEHSLKELHNRLTEIKAAQTMLESLRVALKERQISLVNDINSAFSKAIQKIQSRLKEREQVDQEYFLSKLYRFITIKFSPVYASTIDLPERVESFKKRQHQVVQAAIDEVTADGKTVQLQLETMKTVQDATRTAARQVDAMILSLNSQNMSRDDFLRLYQVVIHRIRSFLRDESSLRLLVDDTLRFTFPRDDDLDTFPMSLLGTLYRGRNFVDIDQPVSILCDTEIRWSCINGLAAGHNQSCEYLYLADLGSRRVIVIDPRTTARHILSRDHHPPYDISVQASTGLVWIASYEHHALLSYSFAGELRRSVSCTSPGSCLGLANGDVVAVSVLPVDSSSGVVTLFSADGTKKWSARELGGLRCHGLAQTLSGDLVTCDSENDRLLVLSIADGRIIKDIGSGYLCFPHGLASTSAGLIIVTELHAHRVSVWTSSGERVHSWGSYGTGPGQFIAPAAVAVLADGKVAIADRGNHRVQIF